MSFHIEAKPGEIAETILLPGDPLRARYIAENFLEDVICYNEVRAMYGYTGTYQGKRVSVQGTGMGRPTLRIYVHELVNEYGVKTLLRVGSTGALQPDIALRDLILAQSASTNSQINRLRFQGMDYAPTADFDLLLKAYQAAVARGVPVHVGNIFSSDFFYPDDPAFWDLWADHGVLAAEMETSALYTLAAKFGVRALTLLTVSDLVKTEEALTPAERERSFVPMIEIALGLVA
jgi:purine-nucleoside phosphorylase